MVGLRPGRVLQHPAIPRAGKHLRQHEAFFGIMNKRTAMSSLRARATRYENARPRATEGDGSALRIPTLSAVPDSP
jgi:hypothetical protein